jgi:hypothetical protein
VEVAVRVTVVPLITEVEVAKQVAPQITPPPDTVPVPVPVLVTVRVEVQGPEGTAVAELENADSALPLSTALTRKVCPAVLLAT